MKTEISAGGIVYSGSRILMIYDAYGHWTFPKGQVEEGESLEEAAIREVWEETAIRCETVSYLGEVHYDYFMPSRGAVAKTVHYFLLRPISFEDPRPLLTEIKAAQWVDISRVKELSSYENNREIIEKGLKAIAGLSNQASKQ
ncbi:MAG TPA: NUDIX hydrolase [Firmicutes bacterium]|nr:NUDIX hydrolase [Bacillota bacterium]